MESKEEKATLRRGWTTGSCATAATRAAIEAFWTGECPDPVTITLPNGQRVAFSLASYKLGKDYAQASVIKDAGDDPDVTHGALVQVTVKPSSPDSGITFTAGAGVGTITKPGLPLPPGEPAINPVPREMMRQTINEAIAEHHARENGLVQDFQVEVSIADGQRLAKKTLNGRLGIDGGLSVLGTTGIVIPFSCAAWIDSIHRGIDIARATGLTHIVGATGKTSEQSIANIDRLDDSALIEMGDFVGGMLKYLKKHPVQRVTIAGGFAKLTKLAQGRLDLHSKRGSVDFVMLANWLSELGADPDVSQRAIAANSALEVLQIAKDAKFDLAGLVAHKAVATAGQAIEGANISLDVAVFDREGRLLARAFAKA